MLSATLTVSVGMKGWLTVRSPTQAKASHMSLYGRKAIQYGSSWDTDYQANYGWTKKEKENTEQRNINSGYVNSLYVCSFQKSSSDYKIL